MNYARNLKLGMRLSLCFGLMLVLLVGVAALDISRMGQVQDRLEDIARVNLQEAQHAVAMRIAVNQIAIASRDIVLLSDEGAMHKVNAELMQSRANYDAMEEKLGKMFSSIASTSQEEKALFSKVREAKATTVLIISKVVELGLVNKNGEATGVLMNQLKVPQKLWLKTLGDLADLEEKLSIKAAEEAETAYATARMLMINLYLLGIESPRGDSSKCATAEAPLSY